MGSNQPPSSNHPPPSNRSPSSNHPPYSNLYPDSNHQNTSILYPDSMLALFLLASLLVIQAQGELTCLECGQRAGLAGGDCATPPGSLKRKQCPIDNWCAVTFNNGKPESKGCAPSSVHEEQGYVETEAESGKWCKGGP